jgi:hypothetical protein
MVAGQLDQHATSYPLAVAIPKLNKFTITQTTRFQPAHSSSPWGLKQARMWEHENRATACWLGAYTIQPITQAPAHYRSSECKADLKT